MISSPRGSVVMIRKTRKWVVISSLSVPYQFCGLYRLIKLFVRWLGSMELPEYCKFVIKSNLENVAMQVRSTELTLKLPMRALEALSDNVDLSESSRCIGKLNGNR